MTGQIDRGSIAQLRKEAKAAASHGQKSLQLLANALGPIVSLDAFLPKSNPNEGSDIHALEHKPVLVLCCDEERKQFPASELIKDIPFFEEHCGVIIPDLFCGIVSKPSLTSKFKYLYPNPGNFKTIHSSGSVM